MKNLSLIIFSLLIPALIFCQQTWDDIVVPTKVNDILETNTTLWLATEGGLITVDKQTNAVNQLTKAKNGLPSNRVESLDFDNSGNLWIGTYEMGLAKFDGNSWTRINYPSNFPSNLETFSIEFDQNNTAWIGTSNGLLKYDGTNWEFFNSSNTGITFFNLVWDTQIDAQGNLIMVSDNSVLQFDGTNWTDLATTTNINLYGDILFSSTDNGKFIFSTHMNKVGIYDGSMNFYNISGSDFPLGDVLAVDFDNNEIPHISIKDQGIYKLENGNWIQATLPTSSLNANQITTMYTDTNDDLWIANGFNFAKTGNSNTQYISINNSPLQSNQVNKIHHHNTDVYVLNENNISRFQENIGWTNISTPPSNPLAINGLEYFTVTETGEYWASGGNAELHYWNGQNWTTYSNSNSPMPIASIRGMVWNSQDQSLWLATSQGIINIKNQQWTIYDDNNTIFSDDDARSITVKDNEIYVSINENVYKFDGTNWSDLLTTNTDYIISLHVDQANNIWTGHWSSGISKYENGMWNTVSELQSYRIEDIAEGDIGRIYFGTKENGLIVFDGANWITYMEENSDLNYNSIIDVSVDSKNQLWIGSEKGVNIYSPNGPVSNKDISPLSKVLLSVFPNPIVEEATIEFVLENSQDVSLEMYHINGQLIRSILTNENRSAGSHLINIEKGNLANGIYLLQLSIGNQTQTLKLLLQE